ncbi:MAG TPA: isocitrate/isopropylmalate dehydrogenase family protein [Candidatus Norongarragalinales archaeon]|nr:isocitrate/isopropylmalate dehydrogenase family protein [Candidatus Norongarragalinales archaeon]
MNYKIAIIRGDGIGPEIMHAGLAVLERAAEVYSIDFELIDAPAGGNTFKKTGKALPADTLSICRDADAILKSPVGLPEITPGIVEREVVLGLRQELDLYANVRPIRLFSSLTEQSPLRTDKVASGIDMIFVRENSEGLYSRQGTKDAEGATDVSVYSKKGVDRILRYAFSLAENRRKKLTSVDKANVLKTSLYWRQKFESLAKQHPGIYAESVYVDAMSQYLLRCPSRYDVVVTDNLFGDILTDEASEIIGSLGLGPGANLHPGKAGMFEPLHGSAPEIAGKDVANPIGMILSVKLMLEFLGENDAAHSVGKAVEATLDFGMRTADIAAPGGLVVGTQEMAKAVAERLKTTR